MTYQELRKTLQDRVSDFDGLFFAFSNEQLEGELARVGITLEEAKKGKQIVSIGAGGFLLKTRVRAFTELMDANEMELKEFKKREKNLIDSLVFELANHEYCFTLDPSDALAAIGESLETVSRKALLKAIKRYNKQMQLSN